MNNFTLCVYNVFYKIILYDIQVSYDNVLFILAVCSVARCH